MTVQVRVPQGMDAAAAQRAVDAVAEQRAVVADVREAVQAADDATAPQVLAAIAAQDRRWREMERRYGLLSSAEVARAAGSRSGNPAQYAAQLRDKRRVLAVRRARRYVYPGFQFSGAGAIRPAMPKILTVLADAGWDCESIALWMTAPNGYLGATPAERLDDADAVLDAAINAAAVGR